jgi:PPOX class probable F420-dependent enzyme
VASIDDVRRIVALDNGLASVSTSWPDGRIQVTVVNAGVIDHPADGSPVAAFVARPSTRKLANLRERPWATLQWRGGWAWAALEGDVEVIGREHADLPALLRAIYTAAGGQHEDWAEFDRVMAAEQRVAVVVRPTRIYVNP